MSSQWILQGARLGLPTPQEHRRACSPPTSRHTCDTRGKYGYRSQCNTCRVSELSHSICAVLSSTRAADRTGAMPAMFVNLRTGRFFAGAACAAAAAAETAPLAPRWGCGGAGCGASMTALCTHTRSPKRWPPGSMMRHTSWTTLLASSDTCIGRMGNHITAHAATVQTPRPPQSKWPQTGRRQRAGAWQFDRDAKGRTCAHQPEGIEARQAMQARVPARPQLDPELRAWQLYQARLRAVLQRRCRTQQLLHVLWPLADTCRLDNVDQRAFQVHNQRQIT